MILFKRGAVPGSSGPMDTDLIFEGVDSEPCTFYRGFVTKGPYYCNGLMPVSHMTEWETLVLGPNL